MHFSFSLYYPALISNWIDIIIRKYFPDCHSLSAIDHLLPRLPRRFPLLKYMRLSILLIVLTLAIFIKSASASAASYPSDPTANIAWNAGTSDVADIQEAFNYARTQENIQLGLSIPILTMPSQSAWDALNDSEKALWLINAERVDRGVQPLDNVEDNVTGVAQYYADYLMDNDKWGHNEDGRTPWQRLNDNPAIGACHDNLTVAENLAAFFTSGDTIPLAVERSVYNWNYNDSSSLWGHRHALLWYPYNDNSGTSGKEGFAGIGRATGPYQGWNYGEVVVMNVFDPCSSWVYAVEYSITGAILDNLSNPLPSVLVTATGGHTSYTNSSGVYTFSGLPAGNYTLTPNLSGYSFNPTSLAVTLPPDATGQDFTSTPTALENTYLPLLMKTPAPVAPRLVVFEAFLRFT